MCLPSQRLPRKSQPPWTSCMSHRMRDICRWQLRSVCAAAATGAFDTSQGRTSAYSDPRQGAPSQTRGQASQSGGGGVRRRYPTAVGTHSFTDSCCCCLSTSMKCLLSQPAARPATSAIATPGVTGPLPTMCMASSTGYCWCCIQIYETMCPPKSAAPARPVRRL